MSCSQCRGAMLIEKWISNIRKQRIWPMAKDVLMVLNDLLKNKVISSDMLPEIISRYSELKANLDKNPYGEALKQVMNSVDRTFMTEEMIPSSEILLLGVAINLVKIEKTQQSQKIEDFIGFFPNMSVKKCLKCNVLNMQNAKFCYSCGKEL